jgi:hypothetical protein
MAENELVRIEIGFHGGDVLTARVPLADADRLEDHLRKREDAVVEVTAQDAKYLVVLPRVLYVKRYARESRVGFFSG